MSARDQIVSYLEGNRETFIAAACDIWDHPELAFHEDYACARLAGLLEMRGISCEAIHGDITQSLREKTLQKFRDGKIRVLAATDVAARGLDIDDVDAVFNYDVPDENEYYIHRIGRTGRAKRHGVAFSLVASISEGLRLDDIIKSTGSQIRTVYFNEKGDLVAAAENK